MFARKPILCEESAEGSSSGGGSSGGDASALQTKLEQQTAELDRLRNHSQTLLDEKKALKRSLDQFKDLDMDAVKKMFKSFESNEEAKLIAEGKLDEVVNRRTEKTALEAANKLQELTSKFDDSQKTVAQLNSKYNEAVAGHHIRKAAEEAGVVVSAIDDVLGRAKGLFAITEDGDLEARDKNGNLRLINNKPLNPKLFVDSLRNIAPHYWPVSQGAGANGGSGGPGQKANPFKKGSPDFSITAQAKLRRDNPDLAVQMQKAAG